MSCKWCEEYEKENQHNCLDCGKVITQKECRKGEGICERCLTEAGWYSPKQPK